MARLPRLVLPGHAHLIVQRGQGTRPVFADEADRRRYLDTLREAAAAEGVAVHAFALADDAVWLLLTPAEGVSLGRLVQSLGRRYVSAYNRRHGQRGTLWDGRYRCGLIESGAPRLAALRFVDSQPGHTSAAHRAGGERSPWLVDLPEYWSLGNTPFDREAAYRTLMVQGLPQLEAEALRAAAQGGWVSGSSTFAAQVAAAAGRPPTPRPRGRPRRA